MRGNKRRFVLLAAGVLAAAALTAGCGASKGGGEYGTITAEEAYERINSGDDIVILDVRTQEEYEESHIPGAVLIPNETIGEKPLEQLPDLDQEILVYCRSGNRSAQAAKKLAAAGYKNVKDFGGIKDWSYETESGGQQEEPAMFGEFTSQTLNGEEVSQEIFAGAELTMVNIWATYCGPCIVEMPDLGELNREYAEHGVQVVGIVSDKTEAQDETALEIVEKTGADYTHIVLSMELYPKLSNVQAVPTTVFVDREGRQVGKVYAGAKSKEKWAEIIDSLLKEVEE